MRLFRLICLASLPMVVLAPLSATAGPTTGLQAPSAATGGVTHVQYYEPDPPALIQDDDDDSALQDDAASRCAAQFRSFEPDTGYYTTYDGDRVLCPHLQ
jgi:BA14K-like protein